MFENGRGVVQDMAEAVRLYSFAATLGNAIAQYNLGYMFAKGRGVGQDMTEAVRCYNLSAANGHEDARRALQLLR
jgi:TPR repeat protein